MQDYVPYSDIVPAGLNWKTEIVNDPGDDSGISIGTDEILLPLEEPPLSPIKENNLPTADKPTDDSGTVGQEETLNVMLCRPKQGAQHVLVVYKDPEITYSPSASRPLEGSFVPKPCYIVVLQPTERLNKRAQ